jgi:hypothetical protein
LVVTTVSAAVRAGVVEGHLADGRQGPVEEVAALDPNRDLVLLRVAVHDAPPIELGLERFVEPGVRLFSPGDVLEQEETPFIERTVSTLRAVNDRLTLYVLSGVLPEEVSGGPLVDANGRLLGLASRARGQHGPVGVGVPRRYLTKMLQSGERLPPHLLQRLASRTPVTRRIPEHPLSLLAGCAPDGLQEIVATLIEVIEEGAPRYNAGDIEGCYLRYAEVAQRLIAAHEDCPGAQQALSDGLARAATSVSVDAQAWALRDAFDGLLTVAQRWLALPEGARPDADASASRIVN